MNSILPTRLKIGDTIGIVAPSYALAQEKYHIAASNLEAMGFPCKPAHNLFSTAWGYAGTAQERADDIREMAEDKDVRMILFGGGDVCNEILPLTDYAALEAHPKILCSYSDSTTILNAITMQTGLVTFYGQSPRTYFEPAAYNRLALEGMLMCDLPEYAKSTPWDVLQGGRRRGACSVGIWPISYS